MNSLVSNTQNSNFYNHITKLLEECKSFYFNVAFINYSGFQLLLDSLKMCEENNIKGKILTSTYLNFTEVKALEKIKEFKNIQLKIFDSNEKNIGFHSKGYIFEFEKEYKILIGSSNITASAFKSNIEWNIKTISKKDELFTIEVLKQFEELWESSFYITNKFLSDYENFKKENKITSFVYEKELHANYMQEKALEKLSFFRKTFQNKALAIASTGTGKTYLSLLDVKAFNPKKALFVVHRENILLKAKQSYEKHLKNFSYGLFTGNEKNINTSFIFTTIQTISSKYEQFKSDEFEYIIIDEAHHIASKSYEKILSFFKPKFLLGLTATPNRTDNINIYDYFDGNIACDISLADSLENGLISPFHYFGIKDVNIDLENIDINKIDEVAKALMINKRVDFIIEKMNFYSFSGKKRKILAFCISKEHAKFMSEEFSKKGISSTYLTSESSIKKREECIFKLESSNDSLEVIFSVDIFNEGIDIPSVNMVLMLRPTNSSIIFAQQLGRGLRKHKSKEFLTVLDFIGNHNKVYLVSLALLGKKILDKDSIKLALFNNFANIANAHIIMDEISKKQILSQLELENFNSMKYLKENYLEFKLMLGNKIPKLVDFINYDEYINPISFISYSKSYIEFLSKVENDKSIKQLCKDENFLKAIRFIDSLLPVKRVYEFAILKYLIHRDSCSVKTISKYLEKYLQKVSEETIIHSFRYLSQEFFDSSQIQRYLKLVSFKNDTLERTHDFKKLLESSKFYIEDSLNYGILLYEKTFSMYDYSLPFLKLYEKYNMINIALLCNFDKIHSSFRGSGFLKFKEDFFLFITIEKDKFSKAAKYENVFLTKDILTFVSKPSHSQDKGDGKKLIENKKHNVNLHIFVRKFSHVDKKVQPFIYLGLANTIEYKGNRPIHTKLKLENPLDNNLYDEFTKVVN